MKMIKIIFVCDLNHSDYISQNIEFKNHIKEHSKSNSSIFMFKIIMKEKVEFDKKQLYIFKSIKKKSVEWFPMKY